MLEQDSFIASLSGWLMDHPVLEVALVIACFASVGALASIASGVMIYGACVLARLLHPRNVGSFIGRPYPSIRHAKFAGQGVELAVRDRALAANSRLGKDLMSRIEALEAGMIRLEQSISRRR